MQSQHTPLPPQLAIEGTTIYASQGHISALEASTGTLLRKYTFQGIADSFAVSQHMLYVNVLSQEKRIIQAIQADDGALHWSFEPGDFPALIETPVVAGKTIYLATSAGKLYALDTQNGRLLWHANCAGHSDGNPVIFPAPAVEGNRVYGSIRVNAPYAPSLFALSPMDGSLLWKVFLAKGIFFPLVVADDILYAAVDGCLAFRAQDGSLLWKKHGLGQVCSSPVVVGRVVYQGIMRQGMALFYAFSARDGSLLWQQFIRTSVREAHISLPTVAQGNIYLATNDGYLLALRTEDGTLLWRFRFPDLLLSQPLVTDGIVFVGVNDGYVYAFRADDGDFLWRSFVGISVSMGLQHKEREAETKE